MFHFSQCYMLSDFACAILVSNTLKVSFLLSVFFIDYQLKGS